MGELLFKVAYVSAYENNTTMHGPVVGIGVFWDHNTCDLPEVSQFYKGVQTFEAASLEAALVAFRQCLDKHYTGVLIRTDSPYLYGCIHVWNHKWLDNGFLDIRGEPIQNQDLVKRTIHLGKNCSAVCLLEHEQPLTSGMKYARNLAKKAVTKVIDVAEKEHRYKESQKLPMDPRAKFLIENF
uniref:RNase H domain-containing protein n=1 Tax=Rhabditophanes sp. KR3021 TaxID=114890 RepID=A0AC35UAC8_9BILA